MSIRELIDASRGTRLHVWQPVRPGAHTRVIYVEDRLHDEIMSSNDFRMGVLWTDLDRFSLGGLITVGYSTESTCILKQLDPHDEEVWELRSKDPEPQVRLFGRFVGTDELFVTHATYREDLGDRWKSKWEGNRWPQEIDRCKLIWNQVCMGEPPHSGASIDAYLSANKLEVGRIP